MNLLVGFGLLAGAMLVSGRAIQYNVQNLVQKPQYLLSIHNQLQRFSKFIQLNNFIYYYPLIVRVSF